MQEGTAFSPPKKRKVQKIITTIFLVVIILFLSATAAILIYLDQNDKAIKEVIVKQIEDNTDAKITITAAELQLFRYFPDITLKLAGVTFSSPDYVGQMPPLAKAGSFNVRFNLISFLRKQYVIESFVLEDADVVLFKTSSEKSNYAFLSPPQSDTSGKVVIPGILVPKIIMKNVLVRYIDDKKNSTYKVDIKEAMLDLSIIGETIDLSIACMIKSNIPRFDALSKEYSEINMDITYLLDEEELEINNGWIKTSAMVLFLSSEQISLKKEGDYNIILEANDLEITKALAYLPETSREQIAEYNPHGKISFKGFIKGKNIAEVNPEYEFTIQLNIDTLYPYGKELLLHNLKAQCEVGGKPNNPSAFYVKLMDVNAGVQHKTNLNGWIVIRDSERLYINSSIKTHCTLSEFDFLFPEGKPLTGTADFDLQYKGTLDGLQENLYDEIQRSKSQLIFDINNVAIHQPGSKKSMTVKKAKGVITPKRSDITQLDMVFDTSDISLTTQFTGLVPYISGKEKTIEGTLDLTSKTINVNEILNFFLPQQRSSGTGSSKKETTIPQFNGVVNMAINKLTYDDIVATEMHISMQSDANSIKINQLDGWCFGGSIKSKGNLYDYTTENPSITGNITAQYVDIANLFASCNNFGMHTLTSKNISGELISEIYMAAQFNPNWKVDMGSLRMDGDVKIYDGTLTDFGPLNDFSGFLALDDLSDIKFETLENQIYIHDEQIHIPGMDIKSNVLNLYMEGSQWFNGTMDYHIDLALADLLSAKYNNTNQDENFGVIQEDNKRKTRIFVVMEGTTENPKFRYDTPKVRKKISKELQQEKTAFQSLLKETFNSDSIIAPIPSQRDGFTIDWTDTLSKTKTPAKAAPKKEEETKTKKFEIDW